MSDAGPTEDEEPPPRVSHVYVVRVFREGVHGRTISLELPGRYLTEGEILSKIETPGWRGPKVKVRGGVRHPGVNIAAAADADDIGPA